MMAKHPSPFVPKLRFPEFEGGPEWEEVTLGALLIRPPEYGVNAAAVPFSESLPTYIRITDINEDGQFGARSRVSVDIDATDDQYLEDGDIVLARTGASVGKSYRHRREDGRLVYAGFLIRIRPNHERLLSQFLGAYLLTWSYWDWVRLTSARSGQPGINGNEYASMPLPLPQGERALAEQRKIADCFGSLDDLIAAQGRTLETLRQHKEGLMQQLFPQPGESTPRVRFPEFVNAVWESKTLGTLVSNTERPIVMDDETEYALVTVKRRYGGVIAREILKGKAISVKSQFLVEANDFLVSKRQIVHDACGLVPAELTGSIVSNEYSVLTAKNGCDIGFFNYFTQQPCVSESFLQSSVGIVIEKMLFKLDWWLKLAFPFPSFAEQQRIADCLSSLDARLAAQVRKLNVLKTHKQGLLQRLFPTLDGQ